MIFALFAWLVAEQNPCAVLELRRFFRRQILLALWSQQCNYISVLFLCLLRLLDGEVVVNIGLICILLIIEGRVE